jgi:glycerol kinase
MSSNASTTDKDVTMNQYVIAIDQGTTSSRAIVFDQSGQHRVHWPDGARADLPAGRLGGAQSHAEIWDNTREVIGSALSKANLTRHDIAAVGITNQRETAVVWDKNTGEADLQRHRLAGHPHAVDRR